MDPDELNEMDLAYLNLAQHVAADALVAVVYSPGGGETYPALVVQDTGEVLALLCIPPRAYDFSKVN